MSLPDAVFEVDGDVAVPTELARGPWSPDAQHGGAPSALLAGELETFDAATATFPVRFTVELMRPVPLTPLRIERSTIRPGKRVQLVQGSLFAGDVEVARGTLLRLREQPVELPASVSTEERGRMTDPGDARAMPDDAPFLLGTGFWDAFDMVHAGGDWLEPGPTDTWLRLRAPIVAGRVPSPFQRVAAAADFGNGVAASFDFTRYSCINPDLTITLHRLPAGEWVGLRSESYPEPNGYGVAESVLHDERGRIGRGIQTVLVAEV